MQIQSRGQAKKRVFLYLPLQDHSNPQQLQIVLYLRHFAKIKKRQDM